MEICRYRDNDQLKYTVCPKKPRTTQTSFHNMLFHMTLQKVLLGVEIIFGDLLFIVIIF